MKNFINRIAVVTGPGGGMGRAISLQLAHKGCDLALVDIDQQRLQETAKLVTKVGRKASCHVVDVADKTQMAAFVSRH